MIEIPLTRGYVALVDDVDSHLAGYKWHACVTTSGKVYATRKVGSLERSKMHREIMNHPHDRQVDHRDGDTLNNRRGNLRIATVRQNLYNQRFRHTARVFPYLGPEGNRDKWRAQIWHEGKKVSVGVFLTEAEARLAYDFCAYHLREGFAPIDHEPDFSVTKLGPSMRARINALLNKFEASMTAPQAPPQRFGDDTREGTGG